MPSIENEDGHVENGGTGSGKSAVADRKTELDQTHQDSQHSGLFDCAITWREGRIQTNRHDHTMQLKHPLPYSCRIFGARNHAGLRLAGELKNG